MAGASLPPYDPPVGDGGEVGSQEEPEWEDRYGRQESQDMEDDQLPILRPLPPPSAPPPSSPPAVSREWVVLDGDEEMSQAEVEMPSTDVRQCNSLLPAPLPPPQSPDSADVQSPPRPPVAVDIPPDLAPLFQLPHSPTPPPNEFPLVPADDLLEASGAESSRLTHRSAKRRRIVVDDGSQESGPIPMPIELSPSPIPRSPPSSPSRCQPSAAAEPIDAEVEPHLSFDVAAFLASLPPFGPVAAAPVWSPPPPPYSFPEYSDTLPTFDLGPSSSRFPRKPRPLKTFLPHLRLQPLIAVDDPTLPSLTLQHDVRLFGCTRAVSALPQWLLCCFDELQWHLTVLLQATTTEEVMLPTAQRWLEEVRQFLAFLLAYVDCVLPSMAVLDHSVIAHVLETSLLCCAQTLLDRQLPLYDVHCRSGRGVYCCSLYAHLMTHSALLRLHSSMRSLAALPHISSVRLLSSDSPVPLAAVGSRWSFQSYAFYLILDLLRLHVNHAGIGSVPFSVYHTLPASDSRAVECRHGEVPAAVKAVHQPVLTLWRELIAYTDHLSDSEYREAPQSRRWSEGLGFCFCLEEELEQQQLLLERFDSVRPAGVQTDMRNTGVDDSMALDVDTGEPFPCFYALLNLSLEAFLLQHSLSSPLGGAPLLTVPIPSFPRADLIQRLLPSTGASSTNAAREIRDRVEVLWELLIDVVIPCYSLPPLYVHKGPADEKALFSSYSLYDGPSPPPIAPLTLQRHGGSVSCGCRPHWSLVYLLLRVGMEHVKQDWRPYWWPVYSRCILERICCLMHVWPCVLIEPLILQLHDFCALDTDHSVASPHRLKAGLSLTDLDHWAPFLFADVVAVPVYRSHGPDESLWCLYLRLLHIFLRMVAEAQKPSSTSLTAHPLSHNNFHHHRLLFHSQTTNLHVISSFYHLFPKPASLCSCSAESHLQLDVAVQVASLHLLAALVSEEEARQAHIHLEKLMDWRSSRCYHAHCLLLHCWASLLSMRIERRMDTSDAIQRFNEVLTHLTQQLLDEEEDLEQLQCALWIPPRDWTEEDRTSRATELQQRRSQVEERRRYVVEGVSLQRRLLGKKRDVEGILGGDCVLLIGETVGLTVPLCFTLDSQSRVLDFLRMDRAVIQTLRQQALLIVQLVVRGCDAVETPAAVPPPVRPVAADGSASEGSQDSDDMGDVIALVAQLEAQQHEQERQRHYPSFLRFLSTAHRLLFDAIAMTTDPAQSDAALLLHNPHRAELMAKVTQDPAEVEVYRRTKRDNRSSKTQYRRSGGRSMDDAYRIDRTTLLSCIRLYGDVSHVLLGHPERLTTVKLLSSFGRVSDEVKEDGGGQQQQMQRYLPLYMWEAFLSGKGREARHAIDRVLSKEVDRCSLLHDVLSALLDPATWTGEALLPLPSLLSSLVSHPAFRLYQQPMIDPTAQCSSMEQLKEHRKDVIDRLLCGLGALYKSTQSQLLRDLLPPLLLQLASHHDSLVQRALNYRAESERSLPPVLDAATLSYVEFVYAVLISVFTHCLPLLHPRHGRDATPLDGVLTTFYEKVLPAERSRSGFTLPTSTSSAHQQVALTTWPTLLYRVDQLRIDPLGWTASTGTEGRGQLPISIRALVAAIKSFWPGKVRIHTLGRIPALHPLCASLCLSRPLLRCRFCCVCRSVPSLPGLRARVTSTRHRFLSSSTGSSCAPSFWRPLSQRSRVAVFLQPRSDRRRCPELPLLTHRLHRRVSCIHLSPGRSPLPSRPLRLRHPL